MGTKEKEENQSGPIGLMGSLLVIIGIFMPITVTENLALVFSAWFMVPGIIFMIISVAKS